MTHVLFENLKYMTAAMGTLRVNCVTGITAKLPLHAMIQP